MLEELQAAGVQGEKIMFAVVDTECPKWGAFTLADARAIDLEMKEASGIYHRESEELAGLPADRRARLRCRVLDHFTEDLAPDIRAIFDEADRLAGQCTRRDDVLPGDQLAEVAASVAIRAPVLPMTAQHDVLTVDELASLLRVSRNTAYQAINAGEIPGVRRIGRTIRISRDAVLVWLGGKDHVPRSRRY